MINIEAQLVAMGHAERCKQIFIERKINFILFLSKKSSTS